jgi:hypothetical protein
MVIDKNVIIDIWMEKHVRRKNGRKIESNKPKGSQKST